MLYTLAFIVMFSAIVLFFAQEFIRVFKRIFEIKGAKLLLPLALVSWVISEFHDEFLICVLYIQKLILDTLAFITQLLPFQLGASSVALILFLTLITVLPVFVLHFILLKKNYQGYQYPYLTSTLIWLACVLMCLSATILY